MCCNVENLRFNKLTQVKRLPLTVRVRAVDQRDPTVDLTGHQLRLISIDDAVFLRTNAITNGNRYLVAVYIYNAHTRAHARARFWFS